MKSKTSKYTALAIIVIGILFIYFIPIIDPIFVKYAGIDGELKQLFKEAEVIYLIDDIKLVDPEKKHASKKMYATIVGIINNNNYPIRYKIGDKEYIGDWYTGQSDVLVPEGALLFLQWGNNYIYNAGNTVYFNYGQVGSRYNGYSFEYIKSIFDKANDQ